MKGVGGKGYCEGCAREYSGTRQGYHCKGG